MKYQFLLIFLLSSWTINIFAQNAIILTNKARSLSLVPINEQTKKEVAFELNQLKIQTIDYIIQLEKSKASPKFTNKEGLQKFITEISNGPENYQRLDLDDYQLGELRNLVRLTENNIYIQHSVNKSDCGLIENSCSAQLLDIIIESSLNCQSNFMILLEAKNALDGSQCTIDNLIFDGVNNLNRDGNIDQIAAVLEANKTKLNLGQRPYFSAVYPGLDHLTSEKLLANCNAEEIKDQPHAIQTCARFFGGPFKDFSANYITTFNALSSNLGNQFIFEWLGKDNHQENFDQYIDQQIDEFLLKGKRPSQWAKLLGVQEIQRPNGYEQIISPSEKLYKDLSDRLKRDIKAQFPNKDQLSKSSLPKIIGEFCETLDGLAYDFKSQKEYSKVQERIENINVNVLVCDNCEEITNIHKKNEKKYKDAVLSSIGQSGAALLLSNAFYTPEGDGRKAQVNKFPCEDFYNTTGDIDKEKIEKALRPQTEYHQKFVLEPLKEATQGLAKHRELLSKNLSESIDAFNAIDVGKLGDQLKNCYKADADVNSKKLCENFEELIKIAPSAVGKSIKQIPFGYGQKTCQALNSKGIRDYKQENFDNAVLWGGVVAGGALTLASFGAASPLAAGGIAVLGVGLSGASAAYNYTKMNASLNESKNALASSYSDPIAGTYFNNQERIELDKYRNFRNAFLFDLALAPLDFISLSKSIKSVKDYKLYDDVYKSYQKGTYSSDQAKRIIAEAMELEKNQIPLEEAIKRAIVIAQDSPHLKLEKIPTNRQNTLNSFKAKHPHKDLFKDIDTEEKITQFIEVQEALKKHNKVGFTDEMVILMEEIHQTPTRINGFINRTKVDRLAALRQQFIDVGAPKEEAIDFIDKLSRKTNILGKTPNKYVDEATTLLNEIKSTQSWKIDDTSLPRNAIFKKDKNDIILFDNEFSLLSDKKASCSEHAYRYIVEEGPSIKTFYNGIEKGHLTGFTPPKNTYTEKTVYDYVIQNKKTADADFINNLEKIRDQLTDAHEKILLSSYIESYKELSGALDGLKHIEKNSSTIDPIQKLISMDDINDLIKGNDKKNFFEIPNWKNIGIGDIDINLLKREITMKEEVINGVKYVYVKTPIYASVGIQSIKPGRSNLNYGNRVGHQVKKYRLDSNNQLVHEGTLKIRNDDDYGFVSGEGPAKGPHYNVEIMDKAQHKNGTIKYNVQYKEN